jgi:hypothetical protein
MLNTRPVDEKTTMLGCPVKIVHACPEPGWRFTIR